MKQLSQFPRESFGVFPTPLYQLKNISAKAASFLETFDLDSME